MLTHSQLNVWRLSLVIIFLIGLTSSCKSEIPDPTPTATITPSLVKATQTPGATTTPRPTATPTLPPLGDPGNPINIGFVIPLEEISAVEAAQDIAFLISRDTDYTIESVIFQNFEDLATAISRDEIHLFWLKPLEYLYLSNQGVAQALLMTNHLGVYAYGVQFLANVQRGFISYYDPETNQSIGDPIEVLQQFSGTRPCFLTSDSLPGYYVPLGLLSNASTPTLEPIFTYSYSATIRALYIQGICDFGVSYALTGDARSASDVIQDLPLAEELVSIIWQSDGIIPNINFSSSPNLPLPIQFRIKESVLRLPNNPEGLLLISTALDYEVADLREVDDNFYNPFRNVIFPLELDLEEITFKD